ncbi:hypothetical protein G9464_20145 [Halostella sp. JP-L12]|uniref:hypothetical protein n=1 Tax=Halostella TaxID=1843185 RepID=UPI000EF79BED|nr:MULTISPECIES: hypothetical protein [Halostella]NHN49883.1 hypothetical protein [Halostella sp. JP-L12]
MKTLEVTDEQYERIDALREALAEDVTYGHVRPRDAVQYLLDTHDGEGSDVEVDASTAADKTASGPDDGETEVGDAHEPDEPADGADEDDTDEDALTADDAEPADANDADDRDEASGTPTPTPTPGGGSGDDKMSAMMNLLDTHDDKWERADSQETRYVVDLPDGGTEEVQTKDDVKAILFKNY